MQAAARDIKDAALGEGNLFQAKKSMSSSLTRPASS
jgi:hypothetical protein